MAIVGPITRSWESSDLEDEPNKPVHVDLLVGK